ncbi:hypothetical protein GCM10022252_75550 [Streptosporangium oxazolinicum]|uniref:Uncharacterized protein n=1 Tax=Streptosporangium oxazolinicum TaxID=909287 RepID=A0ABP8BL95_9ACTN
MRWWTRRSRRAGPSRGLLAEQLAATREALADAEAEAALMRGERDRAWEQVARLTARLDAADADALRAERDDLALANAVLRSGLASGSREELLRERETNARLTARLAALQDGVVTL